MMRRRRRTSQLFVILVAVAATIWFIGLPPDSPIVLSLRFNVGRVPLWGGTRLPRHQGPWPVHVPSEVGVLIKTGYGTRGRVEEQLAALAAKGGLLGDEGRDYLVVGDWTDERARVHDAVLAVLEKKAVLVGREHHPRLGKYKSLQGAVAAGDEETALELGRKFGWELDALKFITGMEMAYKRMPHKKWYMILDDDTFIVKGTLELLLSHLDYNKPKYLGNAVGDYKARFAHGGSGVIISREAMRRLFRREDVVAEAYARSLDETWGDKLVATTLQKVGVYVDERFSGHFNGETPELTRIGPGKACLPIVSFHGLRKPGDMHRASTALSKVAGRTVLRGELWALFGSDTAEADDHVGPGGGDDDHNKITVWQGVARPEDCGRKCGRRCFAWTYDAENRRCRVSPWFVVGASTSGSGSSVSGINWPIVEPLLRGCSLST